MTRTRQQADRLDWVTALESLLADPRLVKQTGLAGRLDETGA
jgi:hypothetical protein